MHHCQQSIFFCTVFLAIVPGLFNSGNPEAFVFIKHPVFWAEFAAGILWKKQKRKLGKHGSALNAIYSPTEAPDDIHTDTTDHYS